MGHAGRIALILVLLSGVALAQPTTVPAVKAETVPTWVFYWVLGLGSLVLTGAGLVIRHLYAKSSVLTEEERSWIRELHQWHDRKDGDEVPVWYVPRTWIKDVRSLIESQKQIEALVQRLVEQGGDTVSNLRAQLRERLELHDRQQNKMLRVAIRSQRAIEAMAGLTAPSEIEQALEDDEGDDV